MRFQFANSHPPLNFYGLTLRFYVVGKLIGAIFLSEVAMKKINFVPEELIFFVYGSIEGDTAHSDLITRFIILRRITMTTPITDISHLQKAIAVGHYVANGIKWEETKKYESGLLFLVRITPYHYERYRNRNKAVYGETIEFRYDHPHFDEMKKAARRCPTGLSYIEQEITADNIADFCRTALSNPHLNNHMEYIEKAQRLVKSRSVA